MSDSAGSGGILEGGAAGRGSGGAAVGGSSGSGGSSGAGGDCERREAETMGQVGAVERGQFGGREAARLLEGTSALELGAVGGTLRATCLGENGDGAPAVIAVEADGLEVGRLACPMAVWTTAELEVSGAAVILRFANDSPPGSFGTDDRNLVIDSIEVCP